MGGWESLLATYKLWVVVMADDENYLYIFEYLYLMLITRINTLINYKMSTVFRIFFLEECQVLKNQQVSRILRSFLLVPSMNKLSQVVGLLESR